MAKAKLVPRPRLTAKSPPVAVSKPVAKFEAEPVGVALARPTPVRKAGAVAKALPPAAKSGPKTLVRPVGARP